jgi:hypothetical protein
MAPLFWVTNKGGRVRAENQRPLWHAPDPCEKSGAADRFSLRARPLESFQLHSAPKQLDGRRATGTIKVKRLASSNGGGLRRVTRCCIAACSTISASVALVVELHQRPLAIPTGKPNGGLGHDSKETMTARSSYKSPPQESVGGKEPKPARALPPQDD